MSLPTSFSAAELRSIATDAAAEAAQLIRDSEHHHPVDTKSTATDIVTATDLASERLILDRLSACTPGARILGEEGGAGVAGDGPHADVEWVVDPIDGTVNFAYRIPIIAVSVAAVVAGRVVAGAVVDVDRNEVFSAHVGGGATANDRPIEVGARFDPSQALIATGFSYRADLRRRHGETIARLLGVVRDVRAFGSAALNLCWVAAGRIDGYLERDIKPWDYAAATIIAREAGAVVELPCPENESLVLATNADLYERLRALVT